MGTSFERKFDFLGNYFSPTESRREVILRFVLTSTWGCRPCLFWLAVLAAVLWSRGMVFWAGSTPAGREFFFGSKNKGKMLPKFPAFEISDFRTNVATPFFYPLAGSLG